MKKILTTILIVVSSIAVLSVVYFKYFVNSQNSQYVDTNLGITEKQKDLLVLGSKDPFFRHVRVAIDNFNSGIKEGYSGVDFEPYKEQYLGSRLIMMALNHNAIMGGKDMLVAFEDSPDKIFYVWVYDEAGGNLDLRAFEPDESFSAEEARVQYEKAKPLVDALDLAI